MKKNIPNISNAELEVMKIIWNENPITSEEIICSLANKKRNPQTIKTYITRLVNKKAVSYSRLGRNYLYYPIITKSEYVKSANKSFLKNLYDGAVDKLVYNFIDQEDLAVEDIDRLQKVLEQKKRNSGK
ncbi:beta-lactamase repressor [Vallitalea longa]|uniref:Beta-lactamase repressor n=1 Tax=Vallitalea longa TaxID=2936439 RepID=A0A9W5Y898_9FIRM|nr:BlaI/MecI/CopY family transcriptional regulator [Vallitalea longa]GKX27548.1 beta-lactamase repressor [Vallitalea longa]